MTSYITSAHDQHAGVSGGYTLREFVDEGVLTEGGCRLLSAAAAGKCNILVAGRYDQLLEAMLWALANELPGEPNLKSPPECWSWDDRLLVDTGQSIYHSAEKHLNYLLNDMAYGNDGSMGSIFAGSAADAVPRAELGLRLTSVDCVLPASKARETVRRAVDLVVFVRKQPEVSILSGLPVLQEVLAVHSDHTEGEISTFALAVTASNGEMIMCDTHGMPDRTRDKLEAGGWPA